jgi:hypothetical protein
VRVVGAEHPVDLLFVIVFSWAWQAQLSRQSFPSSGARFSARILFKTIPDFPVSRNEFTFDWNKCRLALKLGIP